jgi:hypothetical protein
MSAAGDSSRSIAVELALLFLRELELMIAEDPERLVSTEAILSFAAVRRGDPIMWQHWRRILEKYEKADLSARPSSNGLAPCPRAPAPLTGIFHAGIAGEWKAMLCGPR